jgi:hypothetical protein
MLLPDEDEHLIRRYLLGDATEEEGRRFEERVFTDDDFKTHALIVEDELCEDYAARLLPRADREKFERHFLKMAGSSEKLDIINAIQARQYTATASTAPTQPSVVPSWWRFGWLKSPFSLNPRLTAAFALLLLAISAGVLWYIYRNVRLPSNAVHRQQLEAEIDSLNRQGLQPSTDRQDLLVVTLMPGQVKGGGEQTKLVLSESDLTLRFQLAIPAGRMPQGLGVILLNSEDKEVFSYDRPAIWDSATQTEVVLDVPAHAFTPDDYVIKLRDIYTHQDVPGGDYSFRVVRR